MWYTKTLEGDDFMRLAQKEIVGLRALLEQSLQDVVFDGSRMKIDKALLEQLIFRIDPETNERKIVWPLHKTSILKHIDLSGISLNCHDLCIQDGFLDLSDTNVSISDLKGRIRNCDFSNLGMEIKVAEIVKMVNCNLSGNRFADPNVDVICFLNKFRNCNFSSTPLNIYCNPGDIKKFDEAIRYDLGTRIRDGYLDNCYFNGTRIRPRNELTGIKVIAVRQYNEFQMTQRQALEKEIYSYVRVRKKEKQDN